MGLGLGLGSRLRSSGCRSEVAVEGLGSHHCLGRSILHLVGIGVGKGCFAVRGCRRLRTVLNLVGYRVEVGVKVGWALGLRRSRVQPLAWAYRPPPGWGRGGGLRVHVVSALGLSMVLVGAYGPPPSWLRGLRVKVVWALGLAKVSGPTTGLGVPSSTWLG